MKTEIVSSTKDRKGIGLDPRTKILLLLMIVVFVLGGAGGSALVWARVLLACVPVGLLFASGRVRTCVIFVSVFGAGCFLQYFLLNKLNGFLNFIVLASAGMLTQFLPGLVMGYYAVSTTTVSEFVAAMERMHVPDQVTIPLSVMFRFFPTVGEEAGNIRDAMSMRGIFFSGKHPGKTLEYCLIPLMTCSVKIGEELSAAALTRGLGAPVKRTNICKIGFGVWDISFFVICAVILAYWIVTMGGNVQI